METSWRIGDLIQNRWQVLRIFGGPGQSGMGIVYVVYDHRLRLPFAAKTFQDAILQRNPLVADRFAAEALTWVKLDVHPNITRAVFVENIRGKPFVFLEYVSGGDLGSWIGKPRLLDKVAQVLLFALQFCDGMVHALSASRAIKAHRDIKPQNCLITEDRTLKITDFGLAKAINNIGLAEVTIESASDGSGGTFAHSKTGTWLGTPYYMAPEQFSDAKTVDVRADIYSFGVMLFQMASGCLPFTGGTLSELHRLHAEEPPPRLQGRHSSLDETVQTCMQKRPEQRFADFETIRNLLAALYGKVTGREPPGAITGSELSAVEWGNKGMSLANLGYQAESIRCYDQALTLSPRSAWLWYNKGVALDRLGQRVEAMKCLETALSHDSQLEPAWVNKGAMLKQQNRNQEAIECYDRALAIDALDEKAWHNKGIALQALGRNEESRGLFERAVKLNPDFDLAWVALGTTLSNLGQHDQALKCHERAIKINPAYEKAWNNKAITLKALGRPIEALNCYTRALKLAPTNARIWMNKGLLLVEIQAVREAMFCVEQAARLGDSSAASALAQFRHMTTDKPASSCGAVDSVCQGIELSMTGHLEEALASFERAMQIEPGHPGAHSQMAEVLSQLGRVDEAAACLDRALSYSPNDARLWLNKGAIYGGAGRHAEAATCFDAAISLDPSLAEAHFNKALAISHDPSRRHEALRSLETAHRLGHPNAARMIQQFR